MKSNFQAMMRGFYIKRFVAAIVVVVMVAMVGPAFDANAAAAPVVLGLLSVDSTGGNITNPQAISLTSFFYRTGSTGYANASTYTYGYGYGYSDGTYGYGYGYGYGYSYFATAYNASAWSDGDVRSGFFMGTSTDVDDELHLSATALGVATVPIAMTIGGSTMTLSGTTVQFPSNLTIDGGAGWTGDITVSSSASSVSGMDNAATVTIATGGYDLAFSDEVIVVVPNTSITSSNAVVKIFLSSSPTTSVTVSSCSSLGGSYYTGSSTSASDLLDSSNYNLTAYSVTPSTSHCYTIYNNYVYIATRHASAFSAGTEEDSGGGSTGGSSGGSAVTNDDEVSDDNVVQEVSDFADMKGIAETDWRYQALKSVLDSGLFKGSENAKGERVIDLEGNMNRAMAATVVARYVGCDTEAELEEKPFVDVETGLWYSAPIACLKDMGIVNGKVSYDPPIYDPTGSVTRAEYLKLFIEAYLVKHPAMEESWRLMMAGTSTVFVDVAATDWYVGYVKAAYDNGLIKGYDIGGKKYAKGSQSIIRVEAMKIAGDFLGIE